MAGTALGRGRGGGGEGHRGWLRQVVNQFQLSGGHVNSGEHAGHGQRFFLLIVSVVRGRHREHTRATGLTPRDGDAERRRCHREADHAGLSRARYAHLNRLVGSEGGRAVHHRRDGHGRRSGVFCHRNRAHAQRHRRGRAVVIDYGQRRRINGRAPEGACELDVRVGLVIVIVNRGDVHVVCGRFGACRDGDREVGDGVHAEGIASCGGHLNRLGGAEGGRALHRCRDGHGRRSGPFCHRHRVQAQRHRARRSVVVAHPHRGRRDGDAGEHAAEGDGRVRLVHAVVLRGDRHRVASR